MTKEEALEGAKILARINEANKNKCNCYRDIILIKKAHWVCAKCMCDLSHDIAMMSEKTYNKIKKNIRLGVNYDTPVHGHSQSSAHAYYSNY